MNVLTGSTIAFGVLAAIYAAYAITDLIRNRNGGDNPPLLTSTEAKNNARSRNA